MCSWLEQQYRARWPHMTAAIIGGCMRLCYDPHSSYLSDHYRLGSHLGKGAFGEVRKHMLDTNFPREKQTHNCQNQLMFHLIK